MFYIITNKCSIRKFNTFLSTFIVLIKNKVVHLHQQTMTFTRKCIKTFGKKQMSSKLKGSL
jgi:hypothetical protein